MMLLASVSGDLCIVYDYCGTLFNQVYEEADKS